MMMKRRRLGTDARWRPLRALLGRALLGMSVVTGSILMPPMAGHADDRDQERALKALRAGEVLPLRTMLDTVESRFMGDILEVELDDDEEDGQRIWTYKIKLISPGGNVIKLRIDAKTKEILEIKGRDAEKARKR